MTRYETPLASPVGRPSVHVVRRLIPLKGGGDMERETVRRCERGNGKLAKNAPSTTEQIDQKRRDRTCQLGACLGAPTFSASLNRIAVTKIRSNPVIIRSGVNKSQKLSNFLTITMGQNWRITQNDFFNLW